MGKVKVRAKLLACNRGTAVIFELCYKLAAVAVLVPLLFGSFALAMRWSDCTYLTHENILRFLRSPITILAIAVDLAAIAVCVTVDVSAVAFLLDKSRQGIRVTPTQVLRAALRNTARAMRVRNVLLIPAALTLMPLVHIAAAVVFFAAVSIPAPVMDFLERRPAIPLTALGTAVVLTMVGVRWMYAFFCFALEGCSCGQAWRRCAKLGRGRYLHDLAVMAAVQALQALLAAALLFLLTAVAKSLGGLLGRALRLEWPGPYAVWLAIVLVLSLTAAFAIPVGYGCAGALYYRSRELAQEQIGPSDTQDVPDRPPRSRGSRALMGLGAATAVAVGAWVLFLVGVGRLNPDVEYLHTMEITAHRGASAFYPENTMAAFYGAAELGADWIELDVQQTKDGQLVVMHDANLKRTTGVSASIWNVTYDEIAGLDAGQGFDGQYAGEHIPLLSQVLDFAGESDVRLNIELKPTGHEVDMEKDVVDAIRLAEMEDRCVVTSQSYRVLENVKAYDEDIVTVYVMRFLYGNISALSAADHFSVEAVSVTRSLVTRAHNAGKQLFVWTVNSRRSMEKMVELNVDNIITDDVDLAKQCVYESRYSDMMEEYIDLLQ